LIPGVWKWEQLAREFKMQAYRLYHEISRHCEVVGLDDAKTDNLLSALNTTTYWLSRRKIRANLLQFGSGCNQSIEHFRINKSTQINVMSEAVLVNIFLIKKPNKH
jgi:hypothetical protein